MMTLFLHCLRFLEYKETACISDMAKGLMNCPDTREPRAVP